MRTFFLSFLALVGLSLATAQICPPAETLSPCACFESNRTIECRDIRGRFNLKQIFDQAASSVGPDVIFDNLRIRNTPIVEIEEKTFESWRFLDIQIISNENLVYISPDAFGVGWNVTEVLSLSSNNANDREGDIFEVVRVFKNLVKLVISSEGLTSIPDNAFESLDSLETISLDYNKITEFGSAFTQVPNLKTLALQSNQITAIPAGAFQNLKALASINLRNNRVSHVGSKAFFQTESLQTIDLYSNDFASEGHAPDAFEGIGNNNVTIDFTYNSNLSSMEQVSFQPLLDRARRIIVGGASCSRNGCTYRYLYCDERIDWICDNLEEYAGRLSGYRCYSGLGLITDYCANKITH